MLPSKCEYMYHKNEEFKIGVSGLMMRIETNLNWSYMAGKLV